MKTCSKLLDRFKGPGGSKAIAQELAKQEIITGHTNAMTKLAARGQIRALRAGQTLIRQGDPSNDIFFILCGRLAVKRNNRQITDRCAGDCLGEMALIDRSQLRSATLVAVEESVVLRVSEPDFALVAATHPDLWRNLAIKEAKRLRERLETVRQKNEVPLVFVGSSKESLPIANLVKKALGSVAEVRIWTDDVFECDQFILESLEKQAHEVDFAVMVFASDDKVFSRGKESEAPRDNVVFELGLAHLHSQRADAPLVFPHLRKQVVRHLSQRRLDIFLVGDIDPERLLLAEGLLRFT